LFSPPGRSLTLCDLYQIKYYNNTDKLALIGDRAVGNFHEQSLIFLPLLWLNGIFVEGGAEMNWTLGLIYVVTRAFYLPALLFLPMQAVFLSTIPNYVVLTILTKNCWSACS